MRSPDPIGQPGSELSVKEDVTQNPMWSKVLELHSGRSAGEAFISKEEARPYIKPGLGGHAELRPGKHGFLSGSSSLPWFSVVFTE